MNTINGTDKPSFQSLRRRATRVDGHVMGLVDQKTLMVKTFFLLNFRSKFSSNYYSTLNSVPESSIQKSTIPS